MENKERSNQFSSVEAVRGELARAANSTLETLKGRLGGAQRSFYNGVLENLNGARAWFSREGLRLTSELTLAATMLTACSPARVGPTTIPDAGPVRPTATEPLPTFTAQPTATLRPTETPTAIPTEKPLPLNTKVSIEGVTFMFSSSTFYNENEKITFFSARFTLPEKSSVVKIEGKYTGNAPMLFDVPFHTPGQFYLDDGSGKMGVTPIIISVKDAQVFALLFPVPKLPTSFILHNNIGTPWTMDVTPKNLPTPVPTP